MPEQLLCETHPIQHLIHRNIQMVFVNFVNEISLKNDIPEVALKSG